ncbi:MAG: hypothetical protein ACTSUE_06405 [Promethearchaeota archaeon]
MESEDEFSFSYEMIPVSGVEGAFRKKMSLNCKVTDVSEIVINNTANVSYSFTYNQLNGGIPEKTITHHSTLIYNVNYTQENFTNMMVAATSPFDLIFIRKGNNATGNEYLDLQGEVSTLNGSTWNGTAKWDSFGVLEECHAYIIMNTTYHQQLYENITMDIILRRTKAKVPGYSIGILVIVIIPVVILIMIKNRKKISKE